MGQKVNPIGLRLGINKTWDSRWFAGKTYASLLHQDIQIRRYIEENLAAAGIAKVLIERMAKNVRVTVHTAKPGVLIGKKGSDIEKLKLHLSKMVSAEVTINIVEVRKPELDAKLVASGIAQQIERRVSFRRAMKKAISSAFRMGALGIRVSCSGRLAGAEIARVERYIEGSVPLHTLGSDIDYATSTAHTTYGTIGIKIWIYKGQARNLSVASDRRASETSPASKN